MKSRRRFDGDLWSNGRRYICGPEPTRHPLYPSRLCQDYIGDYSATHIGLLRRGPLTHSFLLFYSFDSSRLLTITHTLTHDHAIVTTVLLLDPSRTFLLRTDHAVLSCDPLCISIYSSGSSTLYSPDLSTQDSPSGLSLAVDST